MFSVNGRFSEETSAESTAATIREVIQTLAPLDRTPCSPGEREAAQWLVDRLGSIAGVEAKLEDEDSWGPFPPNLVGLSLLSMVGALLTLRGRRALGALLAAVGMAGIVDEAQNGPRLVRRLVRRRRATVNVVACVDARVEQGDADTKIDTLVVLAHHDAAQTGVIFDQTLQRRVYELAPSLIERSKTSLPQWWLGLVGPLGTILGALTRWRGPVRTALVTGALGSALVIDIWRSETVPGANDNLSAVAVLVALAERLREEPLRGMRVLLVSCGAEETLQDGIRGFIARHRGELDPDRTCFLNLDAVGSRNLVMLEGEGPVWMEQYAGSWLRDHVARCARSLEIPLERDCRSRASTDGVIPSRAGYPLATLVSLNEWRGLGNYHLPTDVPKNLDYGTIADTTRLAYEVARTLIDLPATGGR